MKYLFITLLFYLSLNYSYSQSNISVEIFGANALGFSVNGNHNFALAKNQKISVLAGLGLNIQGEPKVYWIYKAGAYYGLGKWGIGTDMAVLNRFGDPSLVSYKEIDLVFYPNVNYSWIYKNSNYLKLSLGFGIDRERVINPEMFPDRSPEFSWRKYLSFGLVYGFGLEN